MQREYFCCGCGLFCWLDFEGTEKKSYQGCPNEECISKKESGVAIFAVDTMAYAYFAESMKNQGNWKEWSSRKYAPEYAIEIYKKQGIEIR